MHDHSSNAAVGGSACPQADDRTAQAIALKTTRSTTDALGTAHTTAKRTGGFTLAKRERVSAFTLIELVVSVGVLVVLVFFSRSFLRVRQRLRRSATNKWTPTHKHDSSLIEWPSISHRW